MRRQKKKEVSLLPRANWHPLNRGLLTAERWGVVVVGAGGNGCEMINGLARMHVAMRALGHPGGLAVKVYDHDQVSEANIGRQLYAASDIAQNKAVVAVNRVNCFFGLDWEAVPERFPEDKADSPYMSPHCLPRLASHVHILISCVDTAAGRRDIAKFATTRHLAPVYWLDMGNGKDCGQVILGHAAEPKLPSVVEMFPELLDEAFVEDDTPSCSLAEALTHQDLFINRAVATFAHDLLWRLFKDAGLCHHGAFINLESGHVNPLRVGGSLK